MGHITVADGGTSEPTLLSSDGLPLLGLGPVVVRTIDGRYLAARGPVYDGEGDAGIVVNWVFGSGGASLTARPSSAETVLIDFSVTVAPELQVALAYLDLGLIGDEVWTQGADYVLRPLRRGGSYFAGDFCPKFASCRAIDGRHVHVESFGEGSCFEFHHPRTGRPRLRWHVVNGLHRPRATYSRGVGRVVPALPGAWPGEATLSVHFTSRPVRPVSLARSPAPYRAAFVVTDHADFDHASRLSAMLTTHGPAGTAELLFPLTKSVFVRSGAESRADDLSTAGLREFLDVLVRGTGEVALHTNSSMESTRSDVEQDLLGLPGHVRTWIDHSPYNRQNLTAEGSDPSSQFYVLDLLLERSFLAAWAFIDVDVNSPVANINNLRRMDETYADLLRRVRIAVQALAAGEASATCIPHAFLEWIERRTTAAGRYWLKQALHYIAGRHPYGADRHARRVLQGTLALARFLLATASAIDPRQGTPTPVSPLFRDPRWVDGDRGLWSFTTHRVTNLLDTYAPPGVDALIRDRGLHIGHTYLASLHSYQAGGALRTGAHGLQVDDRWMANARHIRERFLAGDLWVTSLRALVEHLDQRARIRVHRPAPHRLVIRNTSGRPADISLIVGDVGGTSGVSGAGHRVHVGHLGPFESTTTELDK